MAPRTGRGRDSLHDDYIDAIHGDQDDGLPPETRSVRFNDRFVNVITKPTQAAEFKRRKHLLSYHRTFSS